ncbi:group 1 truncated hemoglobin [Sphingomonas piscis]|uniref:Group 1 truncated hemoglobin n=1 Tax=Sphingomonas piscis TaxID=2714943 RepID=A0A6G7YRR6_9SPHN|nr:group 1 truncated hemoglobin [Sphingomonas piscis]
MILPAVLLAVQFSATPQGEEPVAAYAVSNANAGAQPTSDPRLLAAWHGRAGINRVIDTLIDLSVADPRISDIFRNQDQVRLRRLLKEQFCYILGAGCDYSGRNMRNAHKDLGIQTADMNALVENLQAAMAAEKVPIWAQNRLLAKLAPMRKDVVER